MMIRFGCGKDYIYISGKAYLAIEDWMLVVVLPKVCRRLKGRIERDKYRSMTFLFDMLEVIHSVYNECSVDCSVKAQATPYAQVLKQRICE